MSSKNKELKALHKAVRKFMEVDPHMAIGRIDALLTWAIDSDIKTISDLTSVLERTTGHSSSSVSRNVSYWAARTYKHQDGKRPEGADFIELIADPVDYRKRMILLTAKGQRFMDDLKGTIEDGMA